MGDMGSVGVGMLSLVDSSDVAETGSNRPSSKDEMFISRQDRTERASTK